MAEPDDRSQEERRSEEAAGWVARLQSSDATAADREGFAAWCARDPKNAETYQEFSSLWGELKEAPVPKDRLRKLRATRRARRAAGLGVLLLAAAGLGVSQSGWVDRLQADHSTGIGEIRSVALPDGSRAVLNTDTALRLRFDGSRRQVELLRGEAYFEVAPMPARPFVAVGETLEATALGTRFAMQLSHDGRGPDVAVEEGRVAVRSRDAQAELRAGDEATLGSDGRLVLSRPDVAEQIAWKDGKLVFSDRPLSEVLATLGRYRRGRILVLDDRAARQRISGVFDVADTDDALATLEASLPVSVTRLTGLMVIVRSR
ncbi:FecR family protein [Bosea sp. LjRoot237]|uniref:FecR family protein n=1 Tax=Bosea sp. LjRoot237 TaxID=3342292 RepID=UPI003ECCDCD4